jgi:hypothetical protein
MFVHKLLPVDIPIIFFSLKTNRINLHTNKLLQVSMNTTVLQYKIASLAGKLNRYSSTLGGPTLHNLLVVDYLMSLLKNGLTMKDRYTDSVAVYIQ